MNRLYSLNNKFITMKKKIVPLYLSFMSSSLLLIFFFGFAEAVYKRSTLPVFIEHGLAQASISDCITETFSAIRTVSS
jgi:hypothetical protein